MQKVLIDISCVLVGIFLALSSDVRGEVLFEKEYQTGMDPESKILRYRLFGTYESKEGYYALFSGNIYQGKVAIQVEEEGKSTWERGIKGPATVFDTVYLPTGTDLGKVRISIHWQEGMGKIHTYVVNRLARKVTTGYTLGQISCLVVVIGYLLWFVRSRNVDRNSIVYGIGLGVIGCVGIVLLENWVGFPSTWIDFSAWEQEMIDLFRSLFKGFQRFIVYYLLLGLMSFRLVKKESEIMPLLCGFGICLLGIHLGLILAQFSGIFPFFSHLQDISPILSIHWGKYSISGVIIPLVLPLLGTFYHISAFYFTLVGVVRSRVRYVMNGILFFISMSAYLEFFTLQGVYFIQSPNGCAIGLLLLCGIVWMFYIISKKDRVLDSARK